jgi:hypothetical protein
MNNNWFIIIYSLLWVKCNIFLGDFNSNVKKMNKLFGFRCNYSDCDFGDQSLNVVKEHLNRLHLNQKPYVCITCGLSFFGEPSLRSHHRIHAKKRFKCDFVDCNYETNIQKQLNEHLMRHKKIKPFDCLWPGCESKFCTEKELRLWAMINFNLFYKSFYL